MTAKERYERWLRLAAAAGDVSGDAAALSDEEREEAFEGLIPFGTSGLRAVMGPGTARMNVLTVRLAAGALARAIPDRPDVFGGTGVCVCYDCRNSSRIFAETCAEVLAEAGIPVLFFGDMRPTPEISFAVLHYGCAAGINITASHNPKEYNGLKIYSSDGGQLVTEPAEAIAARMHEEDLYRPAPAVRFEEAVRNGTVRLLGEETDEAFLEQVFRTAAPCGRISADLKIVYTPFHGTGREVIPRALRAMGAEKLFCVPEQMVPDGDFSTVASPNPEYPESFRLAEELADREGADWIVGSDPDADRVAVLYRGPDGKFVHPDFNVTGSVLFVWYLEKLRTAGALPERPVMMKSIVTAPLAGAAAEQLGCACRETFTGFKYITAEMDRLQQAGEGTVIFSFEESYGCMTGNYCRDKDAVSAAVLLCIMAGELASHGKTFADAEEEYYARFGYGETRTVSLTAPGLAGRRRIAGAMEKLRTEPPEEVAGLKVLAREDMLAGVRTDAAGNAEPTALKGEDVLRLTLSGGSEALIRPSGTEPKLRVYVSARGEKDECGRIRADLERWARSLLDG